MLTAWRKPFFELSGSARVIYKAEYNSGVLTMSNGQSDRLF